MGCLFIFQRLSPYGIMQKDTAMSSHAIKPSSYVNRLTSNAHPNDKCTEEYHHDKNSEFIKLISEKQIQNHMQASDYMDNQLDSIKNAYLPDMWQLCVSFFTGQNPFAVLVLRGNCAILDVKCKGVVKDVF